MRFTLLTRILSMAERCARGWGSYSAARDSVLAEAKNDVVW
jgi:hypothetical protein